MEIYIRSHKIENELIHIACEKNISMQDMQTRHGLKLIIQAIPVKKIIQFRNDILHLFESLSNVKLLKTTLNVMQRSRSIMSDHAGLYSQKEIMGLDMGLLMLQGGLQLFSSFSNAQIRAILEAINTIETVWYENLIE